MRTGGDLLVMGHPKNSWLEPNTICR